MMLYKILTQLREGAFEHSVISLSDGGHLRDRIRDLGVSVTSIGMETGKPSGGAALNYLKQIYQEKPDIVQGWMYHGNLAAQFAATLASWRPAVLWNIRHALHSMELEKASTRQIIKLGAILSKSPNTIIYNARCSARQHESIGFSPIRAQVIANGFDCDSFSPSLLSRNAVRSELGIPLDTPLIGIIGRYHPVKGHLNFLKAARILCESGSNAHFLMVGTDADRSNPVFQEFLKDTILNERLHMLGERHDVPRLMNALDVSTSASLSEAFPNVIGEAMACGIPNVVTDVGDSAWIVGQTGLVVPANNAEALSSGWQTMLDKSTVERANLGTLARARILENFSIDAIGEQYENLYLRTNKLSGQG